MIEHFFFCVSVVSGEPQRTPPDIDRARSSARVRSFARGPPGRPHSLSSHARVISAIASTDFGIELNARVSRSRSAASTDLRRRPSAAAAASARSSMCVRNALKKSIRDSRRRLGMTFS
ncbi:unnamed protein product [Danaus chrysippus]|uniref:(African queen) hypothetical protein n=1 Tax=Danaus chrysippus TaxID=151541 RepID=A0A8J2MIK9_9NEOP|nr:unnamed protein product [Danaus chrysippus]